MKKQKRKPVAKTIDLNRCVFKITSTSNVPDEVDDLDKYEYRVYSYLYKASEELTLGEVAAFLGFAPDKIIAYLIRKELITPVEKDVGYVYVVHDSYGNYKIGRAKNLKTRIQSYKSYLPYFKLIKTVRVENHESYEKELHTRFADKRITREWFKLTQEDIDTI